MQLSAMILLSLAIVVVLAAAFGYATVAGLQTFPAGVALYLLSLLAPRFKLP